MARKVQTGREPVRSGERRRPSPGRPRAGAWASYKLPLHRQHYILSGIGLFLILTGFLMLALESITLAPLLMVAGYCVCIPLVLLWKTTARERGAESDQEVRQP